MDEPVKKKRGRKPKSQKTDSNAKPEEPKIKKKEDENQSKSL